jgi:hypothetical protein
MLKLENINNDYIKISSDFITDLLQNIPDYASLKIESIINCCDDTIFIKDIDFEKKNSTTCSVCNNNYVWQVDLTDIASLNRTIKGIYVKNIVTGVEYNILTTPFDFTYFNTNCPNGSCDIESLFPYYDNIFENIFDTWFNNNTYWINTTAGFCGNTLNVCKFPLNFIPTSIEYGDNTYSKKEFFTFNTTEDSFIVNESLHITPSFFEMENFMDGVYKFKVRITKQNGSWIEEENCFFMDVNTKCKVSRKIEDIIDKDVEANNIHMAHYALINASNCGCNCKELCELYKYLLKILGEQNNTNTDCEC